jgi:hypothetical protein
MRRCLRRLCRYSEQVRAQRNMRQKQSFGHASYSAGLAQFLDIFEPAKWRAFDAGNAQSGVGLQDGVARATGFGDAPGHRQARHQYSLRARKIRHVALLFNRRRGYSRRP